MIPTLRAAFIAIAMTSAMLPAKTERAAGTQGQEPGRLPIGVYNFDERWTDRQGQSAGHRIGALVIGKEVGWAATAVTRNDSSGQTRVYHIGGLRRSPAGEFILDGGEGTLAGRMDKAGVLELAGQLSKPDERASYSVKMRASPVILPRTNPNGLYSVHMEGRVERPGESPKVVVTYAGEAAIVVADDSVYVDISATGSDAKPTSLRFSTLIQADGRIEYRASQGGARFSGYLRAGVLEGEWLRQQTSNGTLVGTLRAERR